MNITLQDIIEFKNLDLIAKQLVEGFIVGYHKSPFHGFSVEFSEHKLYNFGESTKHIDWKVFSKTNRLYTKQYEEETNLRCHVIVDQSSSMFYPNDSLSKIKFTILSAASLSYLLIKQRDAVGLTLFSNAIDYQSAQKSTESHFYHILKKLGNVLENNTVMPSNIADVLDTVAEKVPKRSLVIIFSDLFQQGNTDKILMALQHLRHNKNEVIVFHVYDKKTEVSFQFEDKPTLFEDLESGEKVKVNPFQIKEIYQKKMQERNYEFNLKCGAMGIDFIAVDTHTPFQKILGEFMLKRKKVKYL